MNPWINYHHLYYFMTIAELGSVSKAAEKLRLGQPTLSAQLKQFEDQLGLKLFDRQHKRLVLSEQGRLALDYARNIFKLGHEMYDALHDRKMPSRVSVQIGALDSVPKRALVQLAQAAYGHKDCTITVREGRFDELVRELSHHRLDLILTNYLPAAEGLKGLTHKSVLTSTIHVYGSPEHKNLKKTFPQSLIQKKFVLQTYDSQTRYSIEHWLRLKEIKVDIVAETQDIALSKMIAQQGLALIAVPEYSVRELIESGELVDLGEMTNATEELYLLTAQRKIENPVASFLAQTFTVS